MAVKIRKKAGKKPKKNKKRMNPKLRKFITVVLALAFIAALCFCFVAGYYLKFCSNYVNGAPQMNIEEYKENQAQTTIIYAYNENNEFEEITRLHGEQNRVWVSIDNIPEKLQKAYIDLEDKRFESHGGVDWIRTLKSVLTFGKSGGGSTLTQQLIKNLTGDNGYTINRKFYEILNALNLEKNASKATILEAYLNTVYMGNGCYGVKTAAEKYFGKDLSELNYTECACLAGITKNPTKYNPFKHLEESQKRTIDCLYYMHEAGDLTDEEYEEAKNYEIILTNSENYVAKNSDGNTAQTQEKVIQSYYIDYVISSVIKDLVAQGGYTRSQASKLIYNGGLRIYAAVDRRVQSQLEEVYVNKISMPEYNANVPDAQSAMTIMDYTGRIVAIVGGTGEKTENRGLNRATSSRQPGSSIKPLSVYTPAIEDKFVTWGTKVTNYGFAVGGKIWPHNYGGDPGSPDSKISVQLAIAVSYNTVPAQLVRQMGISRCYKFAKEKFHLSTLVENDMAYAPLAVGGLTHGVTTVDMTAAFASFGNGGKYYKPYCYYKVTNANGSKIYLQHDENDEGEQIMSVDTSDIMNRLLQTVVTDAAHASTGRLYGVPGFETFAKTGTTTEDKDRWFVGGTPYYVAAVWYGCDQPKTLSKYVQANPAGRIFKEVMTRIHKGLASKSFTINSPLVKRATYCLNSGLLASDACPDKAVGWYSQKNMPGYCVACAAAAEPVEEPIVDVETTKPATTAAPAPAPTEPPAPAPTEPPAPDPGEPPAPDPGE